MDSPVTERMCQERHKTLEKKVDEIKLEVTKIRILWTGNGKVGAGQKVDTMWELFTDRRARGRDTITIVFRAIILILISFIAVKIGLK